MLYTIGSNANSVRHSSSPSRSLRSDPQLSKEAQRLLQQPRDRLPSSTLSYVLLEPATTSSRLSTSTVEPTASSNHFSRVSELQSNRGDSWCHRILSFGHLGFDSLYALTKNHAPSSPHEVVFSMQRSTLRKVNGRPEKLERGRIRQKPC